MEHIALIQKAFLVTGSFAFCNIISTAESLLQNAVLAGCANGVSRTLAS